MNSNVVTGSKVGEGVMGKDVGVEGSGVGVMGSEEGVGEDGRVAGVKGAKDEAVA